MKRISQRIALTAMVLVVAVAGGAMAAGSITGASIKDGTLTGKDIKDHSVSKKDLRGNFRGPVGPQGPQGPQGPAGPTALSPLKIYAASMTVAPNGVDGGSVSCPAGQHMVSGGFATDSGVVFFNGPTADQTGWSVAVDNTGATDPANLVGEVNCAGAGSAVAARSGRTRLAPLKGDAARRVAARR